MQRALPPRLEVAPQDGGCAVPPPPAAVREMSFFVPVTRP
jgi:hypothetical protein